MRVECPRCALHPTYAGTAAAQWIATGVSFTKGGRRRAGLRCVTCGHAWSTALPAAIEACAQVRRERGQAVDTDTPEPVQVPIPTLFAGPAVAPAAQPWTSAGDLARRVAKRREERKRTP